MIALYIIGYILGAISTFFFILYKNDVKSYSDLEEEIERSPEICASIFWFIYVPLHVIWRVIYFLAKKMLNSYFSIVNNKNKNDDNNENMYGESANYRQPAPKI